MKVPDLLEQLKKVLYGVNGVDVEGIFQKKGNPVRERVIAEELQSDSFPEDDISSYDPHDVAGVIKEWFSRLPVPLLAHLDPDDVAMCEVDEEECLVSVTLKHCFVYYVSLALQELSQKLREPYKSLFLWMLELMFEVAKNSTVNSMEIPNIGMDFLF
jgi:hypothetical protein